MPSEVFGLLLLLALVLVVPLPIGELLVADRGDGAHIFKVELRSHLRVRLRYRGRPRGNLFGSARSRINLLVRCNSRDIVVN